MTTDLVNGYFRRFYPGDLSDSDFEIENWAALGTMRRYRKPGKAIFPRMECVDGFSMSVQGHCGAYSSPRDDFAYDGYTAVEIGFPSAREDLLMPYIDGDENTDPTSTVYGYVPVEVVEAVIEKHGGLANDA